MSGRAGGRAGRSRGQEGERAGERVSGRAGQRACVRDILTYGKWLLVKIPICPKYVIISRPDGFGR